MAKPDTNQFKGLLDSAHSVAVLLPKNPSFDAVAAALSLKLSLDQSGKPTTVACPEALTVEFHRLVGADSVSSHFGSRNLVITFPGQTEIVDKVSYNLDDKGELNLVITPKPGTPGIDYKRLNFVSGGSQADLAIVFPGAEIPEILAQTKQFAITGSEDVAIVLETLKLPISSDAASNLLAGVEKATSNFTQNTTVDTFEVAAVLMRHGARRHDTVEASSYPPGSIPTSDAPANPSPDWYAPKVFSGTTVS